MRSTYRVTGWFECPVCREKKRHGFFDLDSPNPTQPIHCSDCELRITLERGTKQCRLCGEYKSLGEFHKHHSARAGRLNECKSCTRLRSRDSFTRRRYGLSQQDYDALYAAQKGMCAICGGEGTAIIAGPGSLKRTARHFPLLYVDHDHITGRVRGLLCHSCNSGLGSFKDNVETLSAAIAYLAKHNQERPIMHP